MARAVLIVEDEAILARNIATYLGRSGYEAQTAGSAEEGLAMLDSFKPDVVLLDLRLPGMDGLAALARFRAADAKLIVILLTGHGTVETAVEAIKAGAYDFLSKPVALSKLGLLLEKALGDERRDQALSYLQGREAAQAGLASLLGDSPPMRELKRKIVQVIEAERQLTDAEPPAVLIAGETGVGKEVVARTLHFSGPRADKPFVEINCTSIPAQLLESELFGHERGAFTDARERKLGLVETAEGGTLFLDEIGDMDLALQAKLLKLLEEKIVRRIGSLRDHKVNVRIIAATHRPLESLVREARFRSDLYYRLRIVELVVPPLRERGADILQLARHFLAVQGARYNKAGLRFSPAVEGLLVAHRWPGNVRELRNAIEQAVLLTPAKLIDIDQLNLSSVLRTAQPAAAAAEPSQEGSVLERAERELLLQALETTQWNVTRAAKLLGVSRDTLRYRMEKFQLSPG
ncbi:MAG TPA: sigma-54 dependent transcriptional regulator [Burkholderiales bacterium]